MKKNLVKGLIVVAVLAVAGGGLYYYGKTKIEKTTYPILMPSGEVIIATKAAPITQEEKLKRLAAEVQGEVVILNASNSPDDNRSVVLVKGFDGEMYAVSNPTFVNALRMSYHAKKVTLKGYWGDKLNFLGKEYRNIWIETMTVVEKIDTKRPAKPEGKTAVKPGAKSGAKPAAKTQEKNSKK